MPAKLLAVTVAGGLAVLAALPLTGAAAPTAQLDPGTVTSALTTTVDQSVDTVQRALPATAVPVAPKAASTPPAAPTARQQDPATEPPLHGRNPHGEGAVAVVDLQPSSDRPQSGDPTGDESGEEVVVGRSRGEQRDDGRYHGHITIAALFGNEILGVDTAEGETDGGPLEPLQTQLLDQICAGSGGQLCVDVLRADSNTTGDGSTNSFAVARARLGGEQGLAVAVAESHGTVSDDGRCQTSHGDSRAASVAAGGQAVAGVASSSAGTRACRDEAATSSGSSQLLGLGGTGVPLPDPGCGDGTPDTLTGIPTLLPMVCNAEDASGAQGPAPYAVREALGVYALATGTSALLKTTAARSEASATAPAAPTTGAGTPTRRQGGKEEGGPTTRAGRRPQCSDRVDNDGDGRIDSRDPGCHADGNPDNPDSYDPGDDSEASGDRPQCSDAADNDGDGRIDARDPGCHTDGDAGNPGSYDPNDDSELDGAVPATTPRALAADDLPLTGAEVLWLALGGLVLMAMGLTLRRRPANA